ncbi:MAG: SDR family oxidoreductase [Tissierellia bacterium]|jgi:NAD(P)-dependent dehydrogenase (short-subunit alcohol dehydrogenase family)|nr:SDR family oxidoreductase [Tissierellia bacterium]
MKLKGKVAIVTGASGGMGRDIAHLFAKEGATVYAAARRVERLEELAENTKDLEGKIIPYAVDLMDQEAAEKMMDFVKEDAGKLDILVNNAGLMDDFSPVGDVTDEMLHRVFNLNVFSLFYTMRKAVNIFNEQSGGIIVNVASIGGLFGARAGAVYTASKHAVVGLTKNTAFMYANKNIRCNAICPGGVETEIGSSEFMAHVNPDGIAAIMPMTVGNPRSGSGEEIATIALFLACDDSSFINGQAIAADSGWTAY